MAREMRARASYACLRGRVFVNASCTAAGPDDHQRGAFGYVSGHHSDHYGVSSVIAFPERPAPGPDRAKAVLTSVALGNVFVWPDYAPASVVPAG